MLAPTLDSIPALFRKLQREEYRAFHHPDRLHKADHFFNFCVTAHSLRDYYLEWAGKIAPSDRQPLETAWAQESILVAVADIANSAKHFVLRNRAGVARVPRTKRVRRQRAVVVDVFVDSRGDFSFAPRSVPDLAVTVSDGRRFELYAFMDAVVTYWRDYLRVKGIKLRRQSFRNLRGA
jgi:hypothetical protein